nr:MAG TPA: hypothetical protein [Caudoviricetes sp.]
MYRATEIKIVIHYFCVTKIYCIYCSTSIICISLFYFHIVHDLSFLLKSWVPYYYIFTALKIPLVYSGNFDAARLD